MVSTYVANGQKNKETFIEELESFMSETHECWMEYFHMSFKNTDNPLHRPSKDKPE